MRSNPLRTSANKTLIAGHEEVGALLPMDACIAAMEDALKALADGNGINPLRQAMELPGGGLLGTMPAILGGNADVFGIKACSVFQKNHDTRHDAHQGAVLLFEAKHGRMLAVIDASAITAIRTAAVSAVATKALARKGGGNLAILGSGIQARRHLESMRLVRDIKRIRVWSRSSSNAESFAAEMSRKFHQSIEPISSVREAVKDADIICTATAARDPILKGEWLSPGAHINAVGACVPSLCELDAEAVARSRLFVDCLESGLKEAGDFLRAKAQGKVSDRHILGELGEVLMGRIPARTSKEQITLFESQGLGIEDVAAALVIYRRAQETNSGVWLELNGLRPSVPKATHG